MHHNLQQSDAPLQEYSAHIRHVHCEVEVAGLGNIVRVHRVEAQVVPGILDDAAPHRAAPVDVLASVRQARRHK